MVKLYNFFTKYGQLLAIGLGGLVALIYFFRINSSIDQFEAMELEDQYQSTIFDFGLNAAIYLIIICAIIAVIFGIWFLISQPKKSIKLVGGLIVIFIIGLIAYSSADAGFDSPIVTTLERFDISEGVSKFVSAGLSTTLILGAIAALSIVVAEVINLFKS
jgi:hypothetical protein